MPPGCGSIVASVPIQRRILSGSVRKAKTVEGGAAIRTSRRSVSGSGIGGLLGPGSCGSRLGPCTAPVRPLIHSEVGLSCNPDGDDSRLSQPHDACMQLPPAIAWLVDAATTTSGPDDFLAKLGGQLIADGLPLAGGALALAA